MSSGIYLIGEYLPPPSFQRFAQPLLRENGFSVPDLLPISVPYDLYGPGSFHPRREGKPSPSDFRFNERILISVAGNGQDYESLDALLRAAETRMESERNNAILAIQQQSRPSLTALESRELSAKWHAREWELGGHGEGLGPKTYVEMLAAFAADESASTVFPYFAGRLLAQELEVRSRIFVHETMHAMRYKISKVVEVLDALRKL